MYWIIGAGAVLTATAILSYYIVVAGWTVVYVYIMSSSPLPATIGESKTVFADLVGNGWLVFASSASVLIATALCLLQGVRRGLQRVVRVLMPLLLGLVVLLAIRAAFLPGALEGWKFYLAPTWADLADPAVWGSAMGQAFFSLGIGAGVMITYGSYLREQSDIGRATLWIVGLDTLIALLAGLIIFPAGFSTSSFDPNASGPALIYEVLPIVFGSLPNGRVFGACFFAMLALAAVTSAVSLLEVPISSLIDAAGYSRGKATGIAVFVVTVLATPSAFGIAVPGTDFTTMTLMSLIWEDIALPIVGLAIALFVGWVWRGSRAYPGAKSGGRALGSWAWGIVLRFVSPIAIGAILIAQLYGTFISR